LATYAIQNGAIAEIRDTTDAPARLGDAGDVHPGNLELAPTERRPLIASMLDLANASMMSLVRKITKLEPNWFQGLFLVHLFAYLNHDTHFYENVRFMLNVDEDNSGATFVNGDRFNAFLNVALLKSNLLALFVRTAQLSSMRADVFERCFIFFPPSALGSPHRDPKEQSNVRHCHRCAPQRPLVLPRHELA